MTTPESNRPGFLHQLGADTAYVFLEFILALFSFVLLITGFTVGVSLAFLTVGIFVLVGTLFAARGLADLERVRIRSVLRRPIPYPRGRNPS